MSEAAKFDTNFYLVNNQDVTDALDRGDFVSGLEHFEIYDQSRILDKQNFQMESMYHMKVFHD